MQWSKNAITFGFLPDPPDIPKKPAPQLISLPKNSFDSIETGPTFQCTVSTSEAYGSSLEVLWTHGEKRDVSQLDTKKYNTSELTRVTNGGVTSVSSEMMVTSVRLNDSGLVSCEARIPPSNVTGGFPVTATADTTLTVLGEQDYLHCMEQIMYTLKIQGDLKHQYSRG